MLTPNRPNPPDLRAAPVEGPCTVVAARTGTGGAPAWPDGFVVDWQLEPVDGGSR